MLQNIVTHDGVFSVNSQQRILHWSPSAQDILGYRSEDMIGKPCYEVIGGLDSRNNRFCRRDCPVIENARTSTVRKSATSVNGFQTLTSPV